MARPSSQEKSQPATDTASASAINSSKERSMPSPSPPPTAPASHFSPVTATAAPAHQPGDAPDTPRATSPDSNE
ncbi:hypothetical protein SAMN05216268_105113 [Streptomyces yunnanensis]|uniref:Uncharacterized protein n=1 Tax=Streptomyces yunnanensis TaxID=156453 RepID=A0A9X8MRU0_9ACTN|nr:hypothetical protein SAMN05216268_105113 [Streptomyces yunnanensis]